MRCQNGHYANAFAVTLDAPEILLLLRTCMDLNMRVDPMIHHRLNMAGQYLGSFYNLLYSNLWLQYEDLDVEI